MRSPKRLGVFRTALVLFVSVALLPYVLPAQNPRGNASRCCPGCQRWPRARREKSWCRRPDLLSGARPRAIVVENFAWTTCCPAPIDCVVEAVGFAEASAEVDVVVSSVSEIMVTMKPPSIQQTVERPRFSFLRLPGNRSIPPAAVHQAIITAHDLETIPLAARSFANIAYLAPGTEPLEPSDPTKARITAVSTGGSSGFEQ